MELTIKGNLPEPMIHAQYDEGLPTPHKRKSAAHTNLNWHRSFRRTIFPWCTIAIDAITVPTQLIPNKQIGLGQGTGKPLSLQDLKKAPCLRGLLPAGMPRLPNRRLRVPKPGSLAGS